MGICRGEVSADIHDDECPYLSALERKDGSVDEGHPTMRRRADAKENRSAVI